MGLLFASLIDDGETIGLFGLRVSAKYHDCCLPQKMFHDHKTVNYGTAMQFIACTDGTSSRKFSSCFFLKSADKIMSKASVLLCLSFTVMSLCSLVHYRRRYCYRHYCCYVFRDVIIMTRIKKFVWV